MIVALLIGREGSSGFPGKNTYPVLGRAMMEYPLTAALEAKSINEVYVSTNSENIKKICRKYNVAVIERPADLCTKEALGEDVFAHGYNYIKEDLKKDIEFMVLLFCNAPTIISGMIEEGISVLRKDETLDSAVTVSSYNMWSPLRARKIGAEGLLHPFVPFEVFGDPGKLSCDRDSQGDVWFADMSVSVVRPRCLENMRDGLLPQKWMGKKIYPLKQWGGCDVDFEWQLPLVEYWLKKHDITKPHEK